MGRRPSLLLHLLCLPLTLVHCAAPPPPGSETRPAEAAAASTGPATVTGRAPAESLVMLEPAGGAPALPGGPAVLDQYGKQFVPDQLAVRVGQVVEFRNSEDVDHNVRVVRRPTGTMVMDESGSLNQVFRYTFAQPGIYEVSCDIHPGMRATIVAASTPYAAEADTQGAFSISGVPPGQYVLKVLAAGREISRPIAVAAPKTEAGRVMP